VSFLSLFALEGRILDCLSNYQRSKSVNQQIHNRWQFKYVENHDNLLHSQSCSLCIAREKIDEVANRRIGKVREIKFRAWILSNVQKIDIGYDLYCNIMASTFLEALHMTVKSYCGDKPVGPRTLKTRVYHSNRVVAFSEPLPKYQANSSKPATCVFQHMRIGLLKPETEKANNR
jgi:hypothetical protein